MAEYKVVNLSALIDEIGEGAVKRILSNFSCPLNPDVEDFLRSKAIDFAKQGWAQTHLVFFLSEAEKKDEKILVAYFALANKYVRIPIDLLGKAGSKLRSRIKRFATYDSDHREYFFSAPLIAQLGKNYTDGNNELIEGNALLAEACHKIGKIQFELGGRFTYLECEDKPVLTEFYKRNGFYDFGKRYLDKDEVDKLSGSYLIQMLKYI